MNETKRTRLERARAFLAGTGKRPWGVVHRGIEDADDQTIIEDMGIGSDANLDLIVEAVNSYEALGEREAQLLDKLKAARAELGTLQERESKAVREAVLLRREIEQANTDKLRLAFDVREARAIVDLVRPWQSLRRAVLKAFQDQPDPDGFARMIADCERATQKMLNALVDVALPDEAHKENG